jgi:hypothetical protein
MMRNSALLKPVTPVLAPIRFSAIPLRFIAIAFESSSWG